MIYKTRRFTLHTTIFITLTTKFVNAFSPRARLTFYCLIENCNTWTIYPSHVIYDANTVASNDKNHGAVIKIQMQHTVCVFRLLWLSVRHCDPLCFPPSCYQTIRFAAANWDISWFIKCRCLHCDLLNNILLRGHRCWISLITIHFEYIIICASWCLNKRLYS